MKPKQIVPSHGPFGGVEIIEGYRGYLTRIRDRSRGAQEGRQDPGRGRADHHGRDGRAVPGQEPAGGRDPRRLLGSEVKRG